jgi:hypothetical protein
VQYIFVGAKMYMFVIFKLAVALITMILVECVQAENLGLMSESDYDHTRDSGSSVFQKPSNNLGCGSRQSVTGFCIIRTSACTSIINIPT